MNVFHFIQWLNAEVKRNDLLNRVLQQSPEASEPWGPAGVFIRTHAYLRWELAGLGSYNKACLPNLFFFLFSRKEGRKEREGRREKGRQTKRKTERETEIQEGREGGKSAYLYWPPGIVPTIWGMKAEIQSMIASLKEFIHWLSFKLLNAVPHREHFLNPNVYVFLVHWALHGIS